jgi:hypothetical protein
MNRYYITSRHILADIILSDYIDMLDYNKIIHDITCLLYNKKFYVIFDLHTGHLHLYTKDQYINNIINNIILHHTHKK